jgi:Flp pilus assembly protein TadD
MYVGVVMFFNSFIRLRLYSLLLFLPLLVACQSNQISQHQKIITPTNLYLDSAFQSNSQIHIETEQGIFQIDDTMRAMVKEKLTNQLTANEKALALLEHLFAKNNIALEYVGNANLTAIDTYHSKTANCMSLTIMAYALAKEAGMNIYFQSVAVPEYWTRNGQYSVVTGHVNLLVKEKITPNKHTFWRAKSMQIDFDPTISKKKFPSKIIDKNTLLAMFYTNKGADALIDNNLPLAYQYFKKATMTDSDSSSAWGNLGILYKLTGFYALAERTYRHSINLEENNLTALGNLALLLHSEGRNVEANLIEKNIHKRRFQNPYYHASLGNEALFIQNYDAALKHYKKAIALDDEQHEFYLTLAKIYYQKNQLQLAKRALRKAIVLTNAKDTQRQYIAKLNFLNYQQ